MADKIVIGEIDINIEKALQDTVELKKNIGLLRAQLKEAKDTTGESSVEYVQYSAKLKAANDELRNHENLLSKTVESGTKTIGTIQKLEAQNSALRSEQKKLNLETDEGLKRNKEINAQINKNTEFIKGNVDQRKQELMNIGNYPGAFGKAASAVDLLKGGFGKLTAAAKAFLANPIVLILSGIIGIISVLVKAFKRSEDSMNSVKKVTGALSGVFSALLKGLKPVVDFIANAFTKAFEFAGKVAEKTLSIVSKGLKFLGFDKAAENVTEFSNKMKEAAKSGQELADMEAKLQKSQREAQKIQLDYQKQAEKLRQQRDDETKSIDERIKINEKLGDVLKEQLNSELSIANQELAIANKRIALEGDSTDNLNARAEALTKISDIQERITGQESEQLSNLNALRKEASAKDKERLDKEVEDKKIAAEKAVENLNYELEVWRLNNKEKISSSEELSKSLIDTEKARLEQQGQLQKDMLDYQLDNNLITYDEYNLAVLQYEDDKNQRLSELNDQFRQQEKDKKTEALLADYENENALLENQLFGQFEIQKRELDRKKAEEIKNAEKTGASILLINKKYANAEKAIERAKADAKLSLAQGVASNLATIFGESTKIGKASAIAMTTIETYRGAQAAYTGMVEAIPGPVGIATGIIAAAASVASGIANVKKILAVSPNGSNSISADTGSNVAATATNPSVSAGLVSTQTSIGQGIVSRETETVNQQSQQTNIVLPIDDVTRMQLDKSKMQVTSAI